MKARAKNQRYSSGNLLGRQLVLLCLAGITLQCSSANDKESIEESSQKSASEALVKEDEICHSGIGLLLNFDTPPPEYIEVVWETESFPKQMIYNDCNPLEIEGIHFSKKDFAIYVEDRRYGRNVAAFYSMQVLNCETGHVLIDLPNQKIEKSEKDACRFYLNVFHIKPDFSLSRK